MEPKKVGTGAGSQSSPALAGKIFDSSEFNLTAEIATASLGSFAPLLQYHTLISYIATICTVSRAVAS
jgi:hypothetical protein